jgi:hypothetical protein
LPLFGTASQSATFAAGEPGASAFSRLSALFHIRYLYFEA